MGEICQFERGNLLCRQKNIHAPIVEVNGWIDGWKIENR
jgi:hypothetical protein